jgi:alpha-beta hydrolase superfamily lysophospholipase
LGTNIAKHCPVDVYSLDFKNFGLSEGPMRGLIASFEEEIHEAETFVDFIMDKYKSCKQKPKIIISGLSFGGTICFKMAIRNLQKYDFIAFFAPGLR